MRACLRRVIFSRHSLHFRLCFKAAEPMRPSPPSAASTTPGFREGAQHDSSSMTILPGATALTNSGSAPTPGSSASTTMTSARARCPRCPTQPCRSSSTAWHPPQRRRFPTSANEPFNFLNLDFYAQDTWKITPKLTWTIGIRDTFNSNPLNPHQQIGRLSGSFDSISHDVNQPLNAVIQTHLGNLFSSTPVAILQPRTAIAWQFEPNTVLRTGFGIFSDIMPGSIAD